MFGSAVVAESVIADPFVSTEKSDMETEHNADLVADIEGPSADELTFFLDRIEAVFARFGWAVTDQFKDQYVHVSTVYHLTNGLVALAEENARLKRLIDGSRCPHDPSCDHRKGCNFEGPGALWCPRHKTRHDARIDGPDA